MRSLLPNQSWRAAAARVLSAFGIAALAVAMLFGPTLSPPEFNWVIHSMSEQAGQDMPGAWMMRTGFAGFGLGTAMAAFLIWRASPLLHTALLAFGVGLLAAAAWSNASILPGFASDLAEDSVHSVASAFVGTSFAAACTACMLRARRPSDRYLGAIGLAIAVFIPVTMTAFPEWRGVMQRAMFTFSLIFVWRQFSKS
jgi:hypothetical protein